MIVKKELLAVLKKLSLNVKDSSDYTGFLISTKNKLITTSNSLSIVCENKFFDFEFRVQIKIFIDLLENLPGENLEIKKDGTCLLIKSDKSKKSVKLNILDPGIFSELYAFLFEKRKYSWESVDESFSECVSACSQFTSENKTRAYLNFIHFVGSFFVSTDNTSITKCNFPGFKKNNSFNIPIFLNPVFKSLTFNDIHFEDGRCVFKDSDGDFLFLSQTSDIIPDLYSEWFSKLAESGFDISIDFSNLKNNTNLLTLFAARVNELEAVHLQFKNKKLTVVSENAFGSFTADSIPYSGEYSGEFSIRLDVLKDIFNLSPKIKILDDKLLLEYGNFSRIILVF